MFCQTTADRVVKFVSLCYAAMGLQLPTYQRRLIERLYGTVKENGLRQYRRCYFSVPRKNAKTTLVSALALYHLTADRETNPRIFIAATSLDQCRETFEIIAAMCAAIPFLDKNTVVRDSKNSKEVVYFKAGKKHGYIQALTRGGSKEGKNPSVVIFDELCDWKEADRKLWASMTKGSLARKQPLFLVTTTAGDDNTGICFDQYQYAKRVESGHVQDDTFLSYIIEADPKKWSEKDEWRRVNPLVNEGFIPFENVEAEFKQSQVSEHELNSFKRKRLNFWVGSSFSYLHMGKWHEQTETIHDSHLIGLPCVAGLDLSIRNDFSSLSLVFDETLPNGSHKYYVKPYFWLPEAGWQDRQQVDGQPYEDWVEKGLLELSPGETIDYHLILNKLKELSAVFSINMVAYDPYNAEYLVQDLVSAGFRTTDFGFSWKYMTQPMKELQAAVLDRRLVHGNNKILSWQAGNLIAKTGEGDVVKPSKLGKKSKIDGVVATLMALGTLMRQQQAKPVKSALSWFNEN